MDIIINSNTESDKDKEEIIIERAESKKSDEPIESDNNL